ncbi:MAG: hypothetical protein J2P50_13225 [Hyphomicrobiaceae bacterium]|nr:hypothetical protein [Hyphomicrobiaceae bacterium]
MRYWTKCHTPLQKQSRRALRIFIRTARRWRAIDPAELSPEGQQQRVDCICICERIERAFLGARTDAELLAANKLAADLGQLYEFKP